MQSMKETAANMSASAKAGVEKTKAGAKEKVEKMSAHDPVRKEMAAEKKEARIAQAELHKRDAHEHNAAARQAAAPGGKPEYTTGATYGTETHTHSATCTPGHPMGTHQMSAMPGQPHGGLVEEGIARTERAGTRADEPVHNVLGYGTG